MNVRGGTAAGRRIVKQRSAWTCDCVHKSGVPFTRPPGWTAAFVTWGDTINGKTREGSIGLRMHGGHVYSCPDCGARRP